MKLEPIRTDPHSGEVLDAQYVPLTNAPVIECRPDIHAPSDEAYWANLVDQATD